ncbi:MAG: hypothetical protein R2756_11165 [Bacteroidales bacterium]
MTRILPLIMAVAGIGTFMPQYCKQSDSGSEMKRTASRKLHIETWRGVRASGQQSLANTSGTEHIWYRRTTVHRFPGCNRKTGYPHPGQENRRHVNHPLLP